MALKKLKRRMRMQGRENTRKAIQVLFTLQILMLAYLGYNSPFVANNFLPILFKSTLILFGFAFYLLDFKNVAGWWNRKFFEARQRLEYKRSVEKRVSREMGMDYHKL